MGIFNWGSKKKDEAARIAVIESNKQKQKELGEKLYLALKSAADSNKIYNVFHDSALNKDMVSDSLGKIEVLPTKNDGMIFSVLVTVYDKTATLNPVIIQAGVNVEENRVHALYGAYGPEETKTIDDFGSLLEKMIEHVQKWRLYH